MTTLLADAVSINVVTALDPPIAIPLENSYMANIVAIDSCIDWIIAIVSACANGDSVTVIRE